MIRGTTTKFVFEMPYRFSELESVQIKFWQDNHDGLYHGHTLPIFKVLEHCKAQPLEPMQINVVLSCEETLRFTDGRKAYVEFSGITYSGEEFGRNKEMFTVYPASDNSISEADVLPTPYYNDWYYINWHEGE